MISRRLFLGGLLVGASSAPAIVNASSLMKVKAPELFVPWQGKPGQILVYGKGGDLAWADIQQVYNPKFQLTSVTSGRISMAGPNLSQRPKPGQERRVFYIYANAPDLKAINREFNQRPI